MVLTANEYNALNKIASATKMDCWFCLANDADGDYVYDLETGQRLEMRDGFAQLEDGMVEPLDDPFYKLTADEIAAVRNLENFFEGGGF